MHNFGFPCLNLFTQLILDSTLDPQRKGKIGQVMDITGKSEEEATVDWTDDVATVVVKVFMHLEISAASICLAF